MFGGTGCDLHQKMRIILEDIISSEKGSLGDSEWGINKNFDDCGIRTHAGNPPAGYRFGTTLVLLAQL